MSDHDGHTINLDERVERARRVLDDYSASNSVKAFASDVLSLSAERDAALAEVDVLRGIVKQYGTGWHARGNAWTRLSTDRREWTPLTPDEARVLSELTEEGA